MAFAPRAAGVPNEAGHDEHCNPLRLALLSLLLLALAQRCKSDAAQQPMWALREKKSGFMWVARGAAMRGSVEEARRALDRVTSEVTRRFTARLAAEALARSRRMKDLAAWVDSQPPGDVRLWAELGAAEGLAGRRFTDPVLR